MCKNCVNSCKVENANVSAENCLIFQPKEKPMTNNIIFKSEEQAREVLTACGDYTPIYLQSKIDLLKEKWLHPQIRTTDFS